MTTTLIILAFLLSLQTVRVWIWKRLTTRAMKLNRELVDQNTELEKALEGSRLAHQIRDTADEMRERSVSRVKRSSGEDFWPEIIG